VIRIDEGAEKIVDTSTTVNGTGSLDISYFIRKYVSS
jgi:hypothetical protein